MGALLRRWAQSKSGVVSFPRERLRVIKYVNGNVELIRADQNLLTGLSPQYNLTENSKVFYEEADPDIPVIESFAFAIARCKITLRYNRLFELGYRDSVVVDIHWTVGKLRTEMAKILGVEPGDLRMYKNDFNGQEMRDDDQKIRAIQELYNNGAIALALGMGLPFGFYLVSFTQFEQPQLDPKLYFLPPLLTRDQTELEQETTEVESRRKPTHSQPSADANTTAAFSCAKNDGDDDSGKVHAKPSPAASQHYSSQ